MIFQHTHELVTGKHKTQTRRLINGVNLGVYSEGSPFATDSPYFDHQATIDVVMREDGSVLYEVGKTYAVQPGRGKKAVGRIRITGIRREDVRYIGDADVLAEGFNSRALFLLTWALMHDEGRAANVCANATAAGSLHEAELILQALHSRPADRYDAWVLEFQLVGGTPE